MPNNLIKLIKSENLNSIVKDLEETFVQTFTDNELLRGIPFYGTFTRSSPAASSIHDQLFSIKLLSFLKAFAECPHIDRNTRIDQINVEDEYKSVVGRKLLFIIDNCEDDEKAVILGLLFNNFLESLMSYEQFLIYAHSIRNISTPDIKDLIKNDELNPSSSKISNQFLNNIFFNHNLDKTLHNESQMQNYSISPLGLKLKEVLKNHYID